MTDKEFYLTKLKGKSYVRTRKQIKGIKKEFKKTGKIGPWFLF